MNKEKQTLDKHESVNDIIADVSIPTLRNNRGVVVFSREILTEHPTEEIMKAVFSNFFPVATENDHSFNMYAKIKMYGYSQHFREINEGEVIPEYEIVMIQDENGVRFDKMVERLFEEKVKK